MDICLSPARAAASRKNGARSRGPKTAEGKIRSSRNALRHGLRAQKHIVLSGESTTAFEALEVALLEELAPKGALQTVLARRVVAAAWRLERAESLEASLFAWNQLGGAGRNLGLALIRDCNNARAFDTLLRYRGGTLAEFWRALKTLKTLQAEAAAPQAEAAAPQAENRDVARPARAACAPELPSEPEARRKPRDSGRAGKRAAPATAPAPARLPHRPHPTAGEAACAQPIGAGRRERPAGVALPPAPEIKRVGSMLLAGTAPVSLDRRR